MPLCLDPNAKFEVFLSSDAETPKDKRPTFVFKYLSCHDWIPQSKVSELIGKASKNKNAMTMMNSVCRAINLSLIDWRNVKDAGGKAVKFAPEHLAELLTAGEAVEMLLSAIAQQSTPEPEVETPAKD